MRTALITDLGRAGDAPSRPWTTARASGFSLMEMIVTVAVVGILSAIAAGAYQNVVQRSKFTVARNTVETLNQAVNKYIQLRSLDIREIPGDSASSTEEQDILRALQWNSPTDPAPGAPYLRTDYDPPLSGDAADYRIVWNGVFFELLEPGATGAGLKVVFDASDLGRTVVFPADFVPLSGY